MNMQHMSLREREISGKIVNVLRSYLIPYQIMLPGSRTKPDPGRNSDFDLAVDKKKIDLRQPRKMHEDRNSPSHIYDSEASGEIFKRIKSCYINSMEDVLRKLRKRL
jgi:hypothetical protein